MREMNFKQSLIALTMVLLAILCFSDADSTELTFKSITGIALIIAATIYTALITEQK